MTEKKLIRGCPVCDSSLGIIMHNQSFIKVKYSPLTNNYDLVTCRNCGFVFADTSSSQDDYNLYYSSLSKYEDKNLSSGSGFNENDNDRLLRTARSLEKQVGKNASVLDLGCANGGQLTFLKEIGFVNLTGIDPSAVCIANVRANGFESYQTHIFEPYFISLNRKFDLIILSHVFEHIRDLGLAIDIIKSKLTDNGILYIEVPDASRYDEFYVVPYYYIDCEHINHFSTISLKNLMLRFGFIDIETSQSTIRLNERTFYPILYSFFKQQKKNENSLEPDIKTWRSVELFLNQSKERNTSSAIFEKLIISQEEVIIWGAGQFTLRLLASSSLSRANIIGFVDSDKSKQNKKISDIGVYSPEFIADKNATLLICSALYSEEIAKSAILINSYIRYLIIN